MAQGNNNVFQIEVLDNLSEEIRDIFKENTGTVELIVGGRNYLILQFDLHLKNDPKDQVFDVFSVENTLGRHLSFDEMVEKIRIDYFKSSQVDELKALLQDMKDNELCVNKREEQAVDKALEAANKGASFNEVFKIVTSPYCR